MPRPKKPRFVSGYPAIDAFVPKGVPQTGEILLSLEGLEARYIISEALITGKALRIAEVHMKCVKKEGVFAKDAAEDFNLFVTIQGGEWYAKR